MCLSHPILLFFLSLLHLQFHQAGIARAGPVYFCPPNTVNCAGAQVSVDCSDDAKIANLTLQLSNGCIMNVTRVNILNSSYLNIDAFNSSILRLEHSKARSLYINAAMVNSTLIVNNFTAVSITVKSGVYFFASISDSFLQLSKIGFATYISSSDGGTTGIAFLGTLTNSSLGISDISRITGAAKASVYFTENSAPISDSAMLFAQLDLENFTISNRDVNNVEMANVSWNFSQVSLTNQLSVDYASLSDISWVVERCYLPKGVRFYNGTLATARIRRNGQLVVRHSTFGAGFDLRNYHLLQLNLVRFTNNTIPCSLISDVSTQVYGLLYIKGATLITNFVMDENRIFLHDCDPALPEIVFGGVLQVASSGFGNMSEFILQENIVKVNQISSSVSLIGGLFSINQHTNYYGYVKTTRMVKNVFETYSPNSLMVPMFHFHGSAVLLTNVTNFFVVNNTHRVYNNSGEMIPFFRTGDLRVGGPWAPSATFYFRCNFYTNPNEAGWVNADISTTVTPWLVGGAQTTFEGTLLLKPTCTTCDYAVDCVGAPYTYSNYVHSTSYGGKQVCECGCMNQTAPTTGIVIDQCRTPLVSTFTVGPTVPPAYIFALKSLQVDLETYSDKNSKYNQLPLTDPRFQYQACVQTPDQANQLSETMSVLMVKLNFNVAVYIMFDSENPPPTAWMNSTAGWWLLSTPFNITTTDGRNKNYKFMRKDIDAGGTVVFGGNGAKTPSMAHYMILFHIPPPDPESVVVLTANPESFIPTMAPTFTPTGEPTIAPTAAPTWAPTFAPTSAPSPAPTFEPSFEPTLAPTPEPTLAPTPVPTFQPSFAPTLEPTTEPTFEPTYAPTAAPTFVPTVAPTPEPSFAPTVAPTLEPTWAPTPAPTLIPTSGPTVAPTLAPTAEPTFAPTPVPTTCPPVEAAINKTIALDGRTTPTLHTTAISLTTNNETTFTFFVLFNALGSSGNVWPLPESSSTSSSGSSNGTTTSSSPSSLFVSATALQVSLGSIGSTFGGTSPSSSSSTASGGSGVSGNRGGFLAHSSIINQQSVLLSYGRVPCSDAKFQNYSFKLSLPRVSGYDIIEEEVFEIYAGLEGFLVPSTATNQPAAGSAAPTATTTTTAPPVTTTTTTTPLPSSSSAPSPPESRVFFVEGETLSSIDCPSPMPAPPLPSTLLFARITIEPPPPPKQIVAVQAATETVTSIALSGGAAGAVPAAADAQALAVVGFMSCAGPVQRKVSRNARLLAPAAISDSWDGIALGGIILVVSFCLLHFLVTVGTQAIMDWSWEEAKGTLRFPSLSITVLLLSFQGLAISGFKAISSGEGAGSVVVGLLALTLVVSTPFALHGFVWWRLDVEYHLWAYEKWDAEKKKPPNLWLRKIFLPQGRWQPKLVRNSVGHVVSGLQRNSRVWITVSLWCPAASVICSVIEPSTSAGCASQFGVMAAFQFLAGILVIIFRPYRTVITNVLSAVSSLCLGLTLSGSAAAATSSAKESFGAFGDHLNVLGTQLVLVFTALRLIDTIVRFCLERFYISKYCPMTFLFRWESKLTQTIQNSASSDRNKKQAKEENVTKVNVMIAAPTITQDLEEELLVLNAANELVEPQEPVAVPDDDEELLLGNKKTQQECNGADDQEPAAAAATSPAAAREGTVPSELGALLSDDDEDLLLSSGTKKQKSSGQTKEEDDDDNMKNNQVEDEDDDLLEFLNQPKVNHFTTRVKSVGTHKGGAETLFRDIEAGLGRKKQKTRGQQPQKQSHQYSHPPEEDLSFL